MKINDLSKKNKFEGTLEISTGTSYELKRYTKVGDLYYESTDQVEIKDKKPTSGTIFQNSGIIEENRNVEENTAVDFEPVSDMSRKDIEVKKGTEDVVNPEDEDGIANIKTMIKGGFDYITSNQDKNTDQINIDWENLKEEDWEYLRHTLSATDINGLVSLGGDIYDTVVGTESSSFDKTNQKVISWKENHYKQIHMSDYKKSQYYNDITNLANTKNKMLRGSVGYGANFSDVGRNLVNMLGDNDVPEDAEELGDLNLAGEYNMYSSKPGTKVKAKEEIKNFVNGTAEKDLDKYRDNVEERNIKEFSKDMLNLNDGSSNASIGSANPFSPLKLSDAQARMVTMLKNKNSFLKSIGCIYVKPFYSSNDFNQFTIPFEFKPEISEGATTAKYAAENLLNRLGSMQVYSGTELSTLTLTTTYIALAPDYYENENIGSQFGVNAWEYFWTNRKLEEIELQLRSLVFPSVSEGDYLVKPPIVQIKMAGEKDIETVGDLYKYPNFHGVFASDYLKISKSGGGPRYKKFVVTSVQIDKVDNNDIYEAPSIYAYSSRPRVGQEDDGLSAHIEPLDSNGRKVSSYKTGEDVNLGYYGMRKRGFKVTLQMTEVTENFLDIVPDFRAYYEAWKYKVYEAEQTNNPLAIPDNFGSDVIDALTADSNTLLAQIGTNEEKIKKELEKAYIIGKAYCNFPETTYWEHAILASLITGENIKPKLAEAEKDYVDKIYSKNASKFIKNDVNKSFFEYPDYLERVKYLKAYGANLTEDSIIIEITSKGVVSNYTNVLWRGVETEGYEEVNKFFGDGYVKLQREISYYETEKSTGVENTIYLYIPPLPFKFQKGKALCDLFNDNLIKYFKEIFYTYKTLGEVYKKYGSDLKKIKNENVKNFIKNLSLAFEQGGDIKLLSEKGVLFTLPNTSSYKVLSMNDYASALDSTFKLFTSEMKTLQNNINNTVGLKDSDFLNVKEPETNTEAKLDSISTTIVGNAVSSTFKKVNGSTETVTDEDLDSYLNRIKYYVPYLNTKNEPLNGLVSKVTKRGLKDSYDKIMKQGDDPNIPDCNDIKNFELEYISPPAKPCEAFINEQYNGVTGAKYKKGIKDFKSDKVVEYAGTIIKLASEISVDKDNKDKVDNAIRN